ncbi:MAG: endolytic transglycosylase MltG [Clostridia bacterium]|nr:endolytic transglycosylase MltG [Clostridia bacterium]
MKKVTVAVILVIIVAFVLLMAAEIFGIGKGGEVSVYIENGMTPPQVYSLLKDNGVIGNKTLFSLYARSHAADFKAGSHMLYKREAYRDIIAELTSQGGMNSEEAVTFPEGLELREFAALLEEKGIAKAEDFITAANGKFDYKFLPPQKDGYLEGYLFPDTYVISPDMTCEDIINMMLKRFDEIYTDKYYKREKELEMSTHEVITLASIIEREAAVESERAVVSSVFHNRLNSGYRFLESCATVQYILKERKDVLSNQDIKIDSPYNTYKYPGLPVGPIASPGKASIEAALYPADTDYLYFVSNGDGTQSFSRTLGEHLNSGVNKD